MSIDKYIVFLLFFSLFLSIHTREFDNNSSYGWDRSDNYSYARLQFSNTDNHSEDISNVRYGIRTSYADQLHRNQYHTFKHVRTGYTETISQQEWVNFICKQVDLPFFSEKSIKENCANLSIVQQCKILKLHAYYELPNFFAVVQQLPHYVDYITSLYNTYKNKWRIRQIVEYYTGQVPPNLEKLNESALFIKANKEREYAAQQKKYACLKQEEQKKECEQKIRFDHLQNSQLNKKESLAQLSDDYYDDLYGYDENDNYHDCDNFNFKTEEYKKRIELRHDALRVSLDTDFAITNKEYALSDNANKILHNFSVQSQAFLTCEGSTYQQVIHTELISILDQLGDQYVVVQTNELLRIITKNTIDFVTVAQECNSAAQVKKATCAADVGWALLDYSKAVIQGVAQGAVATVNSVLHPIETMNAIVQSIKTVSYHMAVFIAEVIEINQAIEMHDFEAMHAKSTALHKRIESNIEFVCDVVRETPGPDLVRKTVAFATEAYLTGKVIGACGKVFTHAKIKILPAFEKIKDSARVASKNFELLPAKEFKYAIACEAPEILIAHETAESLMLFNKRGNNYRGKSKNVILSEEINLCKVEWTSHDFKHAPPKNVLWKTIIKNTKHGNARYKPGINIRELEFYAWEHGQLTTNGKNWKVFMANEVIGAKGGKETIFMRIECSANTIHGHPILENEYRRYLK